MWLILVLSVAGQRSKKNGRVPTAAAAAAAAAIQRPAQSHCSSDCFFCFNNRGWRSFPSVTRTAIVILLVILLILWSHRSLLPLCAAACYYSIEWCYLLLRMYVDLAVHVVISIYQVSRLCRRK